MLFNFEIFQDVPKYFCHYFMFNSAVVRRNTLLYYDPVKLYEAYFMAQNMGYLVNIPCSLKMNVFLLLLGVLL